MAKVRADGGRAVRVAQRMQEELAVILPRLRDPRAQGAIVSRIELSDDLSFAKVYVRAGLVVEAPDERGQKAFLKGLESATSRVRREVAESLNLQKAPELRFIYDTGVEAASRVDEILKEIADEGRNRP